MAASTAHQDTASLLGLSAFIHYLLDLPPPLREHLFLLPHLF